MASHKLWIERRSEVVSSYFVTQHFVIELIMDNNRNMVIMSQMLV